MVVEHPSARRWWCNCLVVIRPAWRPMPRASYSRRRRHRPQLAVRRRAEPASWWRGSARRAEPQRDCFHGAAVPAVIPATAKMRLGIADTPLAIDCATALTEGGAESLVHARTKEQATNRR